MSRLIKIGSWSGARRGNAVFVHGLGGHPYDTWRRAADDGTFWPAWLAEDIKGLSVFSLGYVSPPTNWLGTAMPLLDEAANALRLLLNHPDLREGPIAFVCHSLGGLIVKQALRAANEQRSDPAIADFLARTRQVIFLATPHTGSGKATLVERLGFLAWGSDSARDLVANKPELRDLNFGYRTLVEERRGQLSHLVVYEMVNTALGRIVDQASSDPGLPDCRPIPIRQDHISIAKPRCRDDLVYVETKAFVSRLGPEPSQADELSLRPLESFKAEWSWKLLLPKLVRLVALVGIALALWQGVPRLFSVFHAIFSTEEHAKRIREDVAVLSKQIAELQAARARQPVTEAAKAGAIKSLGVAISDLAQRPDERSRRAFEALARDNTGAAERLFREILEERTREGARANREAAQAARNIAAFTRLTNVAEAARLYARASELDPDNYETWIDLGEMAVMAGQLAQARTAFERAFVIAERLARVDPSNAGWQRDLSISHEKIGDVRSLQGDLAAALRSYQASLAIRDRLAGAEPGNAEWQRDLSVSHNRIGDVQSLQGDLVAALRSYQASLAIRDHLAGADPSNAEWQRNMSVSYTRSGDVQSAQGDLAAALRSYQASLAIRDRLAGADPSNAEWQRDLSVSHAKIGDVQSAQGDLAAALRSYQASHDIFERLARADPSNANWQGDPSVSHEKIGDVRRAQGDLAAALRSYQASLAIRDRLAGADPGNVRWQSDLSVSHNKIGNVQSAHGDLAVALRSYQASLAIVERLARADPSNAGWQRDLSISHEKIGDVRSLQGDPAAALRSYQASLATAQRLAGANPSNAGWQRNLSVSHEKIGDVQSLQGELAAALRSYQASLAIRNRLAEADPSNAGWQRDLAVSLGRIAMVEIQQGDRDSALKRFREGRDMIARLMRRSPENATLPNDLAWFEYQMRTQGR